MHRRPDRRDAYGLQAYSRAAFSSGEPIASPPGRGGEFFFAHRSARILRRCKFLSVLAERCGRVAPPVRCRKRREALDVAWSWRQRGASKHFTGECSNQRNLTVFSIRDIVHLPDPLQLLLCLGCSWNGRPSRNRRISPLEVGLTTLRLPSFDSSRGGLPISPLKAQSRGLMPRRSRYRWSQRPGTPCFASHRTLP